MRYKNIEYEFFKHNQQQKKHTEIYTKRIR